jgi:hypothetical protein
MFQKRSLNPQESKPEESQILWKKATFNCV